MPAPFPGMDPYVEHPTFFPGLHDRLIAYLNEFLQPRLPAPYYCEMRDRSWVEMSRRSVAPDVNVLRANQPTPRERTNGGVASTRNTPLVVRLAAEERQESVLEIYALQETEILVTTIEILSLANKTPGDRGRTLYVRKQQEILNSRTNLVEIDLLRGGHHTTLVPLEVLLAATGPFDYHVSIHHFDNLEEAYIYPILLPEPLPEIAIPLLPGDGAVAVDLQAVFERAYDTGPYKHVSTMRSIDPILCCAGTGEMGHRTA